MDIDRLARRVSEQLAARPSRRGIVSTVAKLAAGAGVVFAGLRHSNGAAAEGYQLIPGSCCKGNDCGDTGGKCPGATKKRYQWFCNNGSQRQLCVDCYSAGSYSCTTVTTR
jgi:hypothetical protein